MLDQVLDRVLLELGDAHIADAGLDDFRANRLDPDDVAHDGDDDGPRLALSRQRERDGGLGLAAHELHGIVEREPLGGLVIDSNDEVTRLDAGTGRGRVLDGGDHLDETVFGSHLDAKAPEFALGAHLQFTEGVSIEIGRVRIEPGDHAADGFGDELFVLDVFDVVGLDRAKDVGELAKLLEGQHSALAALGDGRQADAHQHACKGTG